MNRITNQYKLFEMKSIYVIIIGLCVCVATSCNKYVDIAPPKNELPSEKVFASDKTSTAAVVAMYSNMMALNYQFAGMLVSFIGAMSADEFYYFSSFPAFDEFRNNAILPSGRFATSLWDEPYSFIYHANACIEGLQASTTLTEKVKNQLLGEAKFVRAFCNFYLVNMYGKVPLITGTDYKVNGVLPRTPVADVYKAITDDLVDAVKLMQEDYPSAERIRPNKAAANALLARAYLYTEKWDLAEQTASKVIDDSKYHLLKDLNKVFLKNSEETIWQLQVVSPGRNTWEGNLLVAAPTPLYRLTPELRGAFEPGDLRYTSWVGVAVGTTTTNYYPFKYKVRVGADVTEYSMVLRFAEQFLIRAEARAQQNKLDDARADLDTIRHRALLPSLPTNINKAALLLAVEQERRVELFSEWGHRWFDLKRTKRADAVLGPVKQGWKSTAVLFPVPATALLTNTNLDQNEGYK